MLWNYLAFLKQSKLIEPSNNTNSLWLSTTIKAEEEKKKPKKYGQWEHCQVS